MTIPAVRKPNPALPATPPADYAAGRIRHETDGELTAVQAYTHDFPELAKLPHDAIIDAASTFLTDAEREERAQLRAAGVPGGWRRPDDGGEGGGV